MSVCVTCNGQLVSFSSSRHSKGTPQTQHCFDTMRVVCRGEKETSLYVFNTFHTQPGAINWGGLTDLTSLTNLNLQKNNLHGTIDMSKFPASLRNFFVSNNQFVGTIRFNTVAALEGVGIDHNKLDGTIDFVALTNKTLAELYLNDNNFMGTVNVMSLPRSLTYLSLQRNQFNGSFDMTALPNTIRQVYIQQNQFSGTVDLSSLPQSMTNLNLRNNSFVGRVFSDSVFGVSRARTE